MDRALRRRLYAGSALLLLALAVQLAREWLPQAPPSAPAGEARVEQAFRERRSDLWVEVAGTVEATLPDDDEGSRHQRWILRLPGGRTLLVAHNIDLAPRVPLRRGDTLRLRGEYEWNDRGGVVHWTHHDPQGRHDGGWVEHAGRRYR